MIYLIIIYTETKKFLQKFKYCNIQILENIIKLNKKQQIRAKALFLLYKYIYIFIKILIIFL